MPLNPNYDNLPPHIRGGVKRYIEDGIIPGDFLQAVICNDLTGSFARADEVNARELWNITRFFYNEVPMACRGSKEKMILWHYSRIFKPGTQIVYIPNHIDDENDPRCEKGFVVSINKEGAFCRYWSKHNPAQLRTLANSELTPFDRLTIKSTHLQGEVDILVGGIKREMEMNRERFSE